MELIAIYIAAESISRHLANEKSGIARAVPNEMYAHLYTTTQRMPAPDLNLATRCVRSTIAYNRYELHGITSL
jgi:hypothetical protein